MAVKKQYEDMKKIIEEKTKCMINSYAQVLSDTEQMFYNSELIIKDEDIVRRADMFWNLALQRIDKDDAEFNKQMHMSAQRGHEMKLAHMRAEEAKNMPQSVAPTMPIEMGAESPCAKKRREKLLRMQKENPEEFKKTMDEAFNKAIQNGQKEAVVGDTKEEHD